jgi:hypothetical protein
LLATTAAEMTQLEARATMLQVLLGRLRFVPEKLPLFCAHTSPQPRDGSVLMLLVSWLG